MLKVNNIDVFYGAVKVLENLTFRVSQGEITALIGINGAGKTTTLKTISGLLTPQKGFIQFLGTEINRLPPYKIVEMGISHCPEKRKLFPKMTVLENLEMGAYLFKNNWKEINKNLEMNFSLFPILKKRKKQLAGTLSGGEQQMLAIARALMYKAKLLLLDEPSLGLSPLLVEEVFEIIKKINKEGITILIVEQNAGLVLKICNKAYVLENGRICLEGKGGDLLHNERVKRVYLGI